MCTHIQGVGEYLKIERNHFDPYQVVSGKYFVRLVPW